MTKTSQQHSFALYLLCLLVIAPASSWGQSVTSRELDGTYWDHNGSTMIMKVEPYGDVTISYHTPKRSMQDVVQGGTLLVRLHALDGGISGIAHVFKSGCGAAQYNVRGRFADSRTLLLQGPSPVWSGCRVKGFTNRSSNARLKFTLLGGGRQQISGTSRETPSTTYDGPARVIKLPAPSLSPRLSIIEPSLPCNFRIEGRIQTGLLDEIKKKFSKEYIGRDLVCLDSPGGSFPEALRIADFFKSKPVATKIEAGARCESACALMFMAGNFSYFEGGKSAWRVLHPRGRLGFHAPHLPLRAESYPKEEVENAWNISLDVVSNTIFQLILAHRDFEDGGERAMKVSLLGHMLKTPGADMYYIDTVDKVGRWDISIFPVKNFSPRSDRDYLHACFNKLSWDMDLFSEDMLRAHGRRNYSPSVNTHNGEVYVGINELVGPSGCSFPRAQPDNTPPGYVSIVADERTFEIPSWYFLDPRTPLVSLAD